MTNAYLAELRNYMQEHAGAEVTRQASFIAAYFENTDPDELEARGAATLYAIANAHWRLLCSPRVGAQARLRVFNPTLAEDGYVSEHSVVQIVHDDMPFLVDSVTMAINRGNRTAHWIVHPLMSVLRDAGGELISVSSLAGAADSSSAALSESIILVECDRIVSAAEQTALATELSRVLGDVRSAVQDWAPMLERMQQVSEAATSSSLPVEDLQEGVAFLHWLQDRHFTFLGARDYDLQRTPQGVCLIARPESGLGILRGKPRTAQTELPPEAIGLIESRQLVLLTKAMTRASVHRPAWLDYVGVKRFDALGQVVGETRFLGLYTSSAYSAPVSEIPKVRRRTAEVLRQAAVVPDSHAAKSLQSILDAYPRDELLQTDGETLCEHALGILRLQERQRTRIFARRDPFGRFISVQVFVARDRFNTELRVKIGAELMQALDGQSIEFTPMLTDSPMARIHYLVRSKTSAPQLHKLSALQARIARLAQRWEDDCCSELLRAHGEGQGLLLAHRFADAFPTAYREDFGAAVGAEDAEVLASLTSAAPLAVKLYRPLDAAAGLLRFKIYNTTKVALSDSLPVLERMGARVLDERPYCIGSADTGLWLHDLGLQFPLGTDLSRVKSRFEALFCQVWCGAVESDDLNQLVLNSSLDARAIAILRAYGRYFKQLGFAFSQNYIEAALNRNPHIAQNLFDLFTARLDPCTGQGVSATQRQQRQQQGIDQIEADLRAVASLDEDRILRQFLSGILATLRSNAWQRSATDGPKPYISFKFDPHQLSGVPEPRPRYEIWVYSPRFEGIHLRHGKVARGGIRWSDRREDFRTEILGLVKAQHVKNTVIVPVGSKGGFVLKRAPAASDREAFMNEGIACYRLFLCGLLDLTDNWVKGVVVTPPELVRHDADDPYLVLAADKGTATFSDIANAVSADYAYWLGDAFASGGSLGYDHKKMGITARGAWESVKRHFRSLAVDTQRTPFTVVGIGDMSGDVFGNGMLLSAQIKLLAAFDHRHIFIDPAPDPERSHAERARLFALPRSSWDDYDKSLISAGGGVYSRSAKQITPSAQACAALGIESAALTPVELLRAVLLAPVDLLYNGGIGTYVKAGFESHQQVGDKAGDALRVNGHELRCKVLVEGGNLGCTQNGRIEFARRGGLIYTDAIDNSAGVDCSDHEVNIKILLGSVVEAGDMTLKQRNDLLASMTDEVGLLVLTDNYYQTQALDIANHHALYLLDEQQRLMQLLESHGRLNRAIEFLPTDEEIAIRRAQKCGLTAPENAVLLAYAKMAVFDELMASNLPDDPYFKRVLRAYFPKTLGEQFGSAIAAHPLRREIIATFMTNTVVNRTGATFVNFMASQAGAASADVIRAFTLAREIFGLEPLWDQIDALDDVVDASLQLDLLIRLTSIAQRASRWMLRVCAKNTDLPTLIHAYQPAARELRRHLAEWLSQGALASWQLASKKLVEAGVEQSLADNLSALEFVFPALDLVDLAGQANTGLEQSARIYFAIDAELGLTGWRAQIGRLPTDTLWQTQARASARDDVYVIASQITQALLTRQESLNEWRARHASAIERLRRWLKEVSGQPADLAPISVALRELRLLA